MTTGPAPPPAGTVICADADLPASGAGVFQGMAGTAEFDVIVVRQAFGLRGYVNCCPHQGLPLDVTPGRVMTADRTHLLCGNHGAQFRLDDGVCVRGPCRDRRLSPVPLALADGRVVVAGDDR